MIQQLKQFFGSFKKHHDAGKDIHAEIAATIRERQRLFENFRYCFETDTALEQGDVHAQLRATIRQHSHVMQQFYAATHHEKIAA